MVPDWPKSFWQRCCIAVCIEFKKLKRMAELPAVFLFAAMVTAGAFAGSQEPSKAVGLYGDTDTMVSAAEVIYYVDPKELFSMLLMVLVMWEATKWLALEVGKTLIIDWLLRKAKELYRSRYPAAAADPGGPAAPLQEAPAGSD